MADPSQFMAYMDDLYGPDEEVPTPADTTLGALLELIDRLDARQVAAEELVVQLVGRIEQLSMLLAGAVQSIQQPRVRTVTRDEMGQIVSVVDAVC